MPDYRSTVNFGTRYTPSKSQADEAARARKQVEAGEARAARDSAARRKAERTAKMAEGYRGAMARRRNRPNTGGTSLNIGPAGTQFRKALEE